MDTSKEYIEMCRKAVEVQELWSPISGDVSYLMDIDCVSIWSYGLYKTDISCAEIWLPRQDQLQDMVGEDTDYHTLMKFDTWVFTLARIYDDIIIEKFSMEQLWLAFVMHEKYGKKWDGEDWVKETGNRKQERSENGAITK